MDHLLQSGFSEEQLQEFGALIPPVSLPIALDKSPAVAHKASRPIANDHSVDRNGFKEPLLSDEEFQRIAQQPEIVASNGAPALNGDVHHDAVAPIAVIGMSCRLPGDASDPRKLWDLVSEGRSAWSIVPAEKFNIDAFYHPDPERMGTV